MRMRERLAHAPDQLGFVEFNFLWGQATRV